MADPSCSYAMRHCTLMCAANGRVAMLGFSSLALNELSTHTPALEQAANAVPAIIFVSLAFTFATIVPKLVSGTSLKVCQALRPHRCQLSEMLRLGPRVQLFPQISDCHHLAPNLK